MLVEEAGSSLGRCEDTFVYELQDGEEMQGKVYRFLVAFVAAFVAFADSAFGWHLRAQDVLGVVLTAIALIVGESHVQAKREESRSNAQMMDQLRDFLNSMLVVLGEVKREHAAGPAAQDPGKGGAGTTP